MHLTKIKILSVAALAPLLVALAGPSAPSRAAVNPLPAGWKLNLQEDFNTLNTARWKVNNNTVAPNEDSYLLARNVTVSGGILRMQGKKESVGGRKYTSGNMNTVGKYTLPANFRAEVRAKVPFQQGLWAAPLWFRPTSGDGEIDLAETYGFDRAKPAVHQTIHTAYGATHKQVSYSKLFSSFSTLKATDWHTYTIEKVKGRITMWVDGVKTSEYTPANPSWYSAYYDAGKTWTMRVNLQIGGKWAGQPDSTTNWTGDNSAMQLDYIKTWVPG
jgi:beta-glucanase (GH16 family)